MKKIYIFLMLLIGIIVFVLLRGNEDTWLCEKGEWVKHGNPSFPKPLVLCDGKGVQALPHNKDDCLKMGGVWEKQGPEPFETCDIKTKDGGRGCSDISQCEGTCMVKLSDDEFSGGMRGKTFKKNGACSLWRVTLGCFGMVKQGKMSVICVD
ncbi:hypothetical protein COY90_02225 [Candidatus Roizmanbacteria bacterium CG_4_10_14_0_8_um_filter_39_9]|uniref:Uncharacterized protein n=1 Tax=Candidatus Roizmanbacteria bacterium CG_4_10_14_0_8_um_filter_39_9 TaxID=1974829 RepID=A0A2M7QD46_9BACT|nr:MAG: hypothetical protein COY90_02225 [Candidatus Roizmanbacteria bacterium CG_4_10_14_0_8_um_filter_39_9]